jgi:hypothetical protein
MTMPYKRAPGGTVPTSEPEDPELEYPEFEDPEPAEGPETSLYPLCASPKG